MKTTVMDITPEWATTVLERHSQRLVEGAFRQRPIKNRLVLKFAEDMKAGAWKLTHQGIAFDESENLLDGQHRLMGVVKARCRVRMMVTTGIPIDGAMDAMDCGASRSVATQLQVSHGYANATFIASVIRNVAQFILDSPKRAGTEYAHTTMSSAIWMLESLNFKTGIERVNTLAGSTKFKSAYWISPWLIYWKSHPEKAEAFARDVILLEGLKAGHPALQTHRYIVGIAERQRRNRTHVTRVVAQCLLAYHEGRTIGQLAPSKEAHLWLLNLDGGVMAAKVTQRLSSIVNQPEVEAVKKNGK